jgi:hypothetical protein
MAETTPRTLTDCWFPQELGKRSPFFPAATRVSIPNREGLTLATAWGSLTLHGHTLIVADQSVLVALLQVADQAVWDGTTWRWHSTSSLHQLVRRMGYASPCQGVYTSRRESLQALATTVFEVRTAQFRLVAPLVELRWEHDPDPTGRLTVTLHAALLAELRIGRVEVLSWPVWRRLSSLGKLLYAFLSAQTGDRWYAIALAKLRDALNAAPIPGCYAGWRMDNFRRENERQLAILRAARVIGPVRWRTTAEGASLVVWLPAQQTLPLASSVFS